MVTTVLRTVCGLVGTAGRRGSNPNIRLDVPRRSVHTSPVQPRQSQPLSDWVSGVFLAQPRHAPDNIYKTMGMIHPSLQSNVTPFNLHCRTVMDRWAIKGLRIAPKDIPQKRSVVVVSGNQVGERAPIGVSLYVAAALSQRPIAGVEVTVFPVMKPKEYELQWRSEQVHNEVKQLGLMGMGSGVPLDIFEQRNYGVEGPLRSYVMKRSTNYVDVEMDLDATQPYLHLRGNSLLRPLHNANISMTTMPPPPLPNMAVPQLAEPGSTTLFGAVASPPTVVLELRDRDHTLSEDEISACGDRVLAAIEELVADTANPRGLVL